jgi:glycine dehydrogenase subunit 1
MRFIPNTPAERRAMLDVIGAPSLDALFAGIPRDARLARLLALPSAQTETDLLRELGRQAQSNAEVGEYLCFLGGGAYDHAIPSPIHHLISRGEFATAYTPYQPEASQGTLRAIFEYQTIIAELTGMDVANASLYDGASSLAEALLMAHAATGRDAVVLSESVNPLHRRVAETYGSGVGLRLNSVELSEGIADLGRLQEAVTGETAAVVIQQPNFFGCLEDVKAAGEIAHAAGALLVVSADPVNLGVLAPPGALGADIAVGEGQGLGVPLQYGGPYLGVLATRESLVRRMPGRLVGETRDIEGRRGFVLTLQTREQHIRREKATSNICTNVALCALMATMYSALLGPEGLRRVGELSAAKAHYAAELLTRIPGVRLRFKAPYFKEFCLELPKAPEGVVDRLLQRKILAGVPLGPFVPAYRDCLLVAVTEKRTKEEIETFAEALAAELVQPPGAKSRSQRPPAARSP